MRKLALLLTLLAASVSHAQTIQNPSFEVSAPVGAGNWNYGPVSGWNCGGTGGLFTPALAAVRSGVVGTTTLWLNPGASCSQDLGPVQAGATYILTYLVGSQIGFNPTGFVVSLGIPGCVTTGPTPSTGAITQQTMTCTAGASGELVLTLSNTSSQVIFDNLALTVSVPQIPPRIVTYQFIGQLLYCTKCDGTDDSSTGTSAYSGAIISITQDANQVCSGKLNAGGQFSCSAGINLAPAIVNLGLGVTSPAGKSLAPVITQSVAQILVSGRGVVTFILRLDATSSQPRGVQLFTQ